MVARIISTCLTRAAVVAALAMLAWPAAAAENYDVRLTRIPIEASTRASVTGSGSASVTLDGVKLKVRGSFSGLAGAATGGELHDGPARGVRGPAIAHFPLPSAVAGDFEAEVTLSPAEVESLRQGRLYIQIQSAAAPDGNLWGWLLR